MREIKQWKKDKVVELAKMIDLSPVLGVVDMRSLPAKQLQHMRQEFRGKLRIIMSKKALVTRALEKSKFKDLAATISGMPALILTDMNPLRLAILLNKSRVPAPAKAGDTAPRDIEVKAGSTPFTPGPVIAELSDIGIKTKVEGGKLAVIKDTVVAKNGAVISESISSILKRLGIFPMEVGLNLVAVSDGKGIFSGETLRISEKDYESRVVAAYHQAFNLACSASILVKENVAIILSKARSQAYNLAISAGVVGDETVSALLSLANGRCMVVANELNSRDPKALSEGLSKFITEMGIKKVFGGN